MKRNVISLLFLMILSLASLSVNAQKKLNDNAIVSQHKRMVFERWGDWRPYGKYLFGIQTNFAYATVWGMWAPKRNQKYKKGKDIRPLRAGGKETMRFGGVKIQENRIEEVKKLVDSIQKKNLRDLAHVTSLTVDVDPLWLLYYKRMLKPLKEFPENVESWGFDNRSFNRLKSTGWISHLKEMLDIAKDKLNISRSVDMPRGKRFLMYHQALMMWRVFEKEFHKGKKTAEISFRMELKNKQSKEFKINSFSDKEIVEAVMKKYKNKY